MESHGRNNLWLCRTRFSNPGVNKTKKAFCLNRLHKDSEEVIVWLLTLVLQYLFGYSTSKWNLIKIWSPTVLLPPSFEKASLRVGILETVKFQSKFFKKIFHWLKMMDQSVITKKYILWFMNMYSAGVRPGPVVHLHNSNL